MRLLLLPGSATVFLCGCVQTNATILNPTALARPPVCPEAVVIYRTPDLVPKPFEEIAIVNAKGESSWTNESEMMNAIRKKAAQMGANGVVLGQVKNPSAGAEVAGAFLGTGASRRGEATAVYVTADSLKSLQVCREARQRK